MSTQEKTTALIDLQQLGEQLALTAKPIHQAIDKSKKPFNLPANKLGNKVPELAKLGDLMIFRISKDEEWGSYHSKTLALFLNDEGKPTVFTADLKPLDKVKFLHYSTGIKGFQTIEYQGLHLKIETSISREYRENLSDWGVVEGEGVPDSKYLADVPHPTIPLKDLSKDIVFQIVKPAGTDKRYDSQRYQIKNTKSNEEFEVFENSDMRDIIAEHGIPCEFKIGDVRKRNGNGKGKKDKEADAYIVRLIDVKKPTFEDIKL